MTLFLLAYFAGVLTIATPCILPILPFVLARAEEPFRRGALPMLLGLALAFAAVASLASIAGAWAIRWNRDGRTVALVLIALIGLSMLLPNLTARLTAPIVSIGGRRGIWVQRRAAGKGMSGGYSVLLGVATGLVWAPCAGPILGLILTTAALRGPGVHTSLLLLTYALGAATSLAVGSLLGGRLFSIIKRSARWGDALHRILGAAVVAGASIIWFGSSNGLMAHLSSARVNMLEQDVTAAVSNVRAGGIATVAYAAEEPALSASLRSLLGAPQWLNTRPLQPKDVQGKVVLVNFWTFSCINCLRVLPHVRSWASKYKDRGLVVVGVQTPEFAFEKDLGNVRKALVDLGVDYPVAIDNDFKIWRAFDNEAWPALYFIGANGKIRRRVLGEGIYDDSEVLIQQLLSEANGTRVANEIAPVSGKGPEAAADEGDLGSPETYIGFAQFRSFASPGYVSENSPKRYQPVKALALNHWTLTGVWTIGSEFAALNQAPGSIAYRFHARDLHLVLANSSPGHPVRFRVKIDGAPPGVDHGSDVDADGWGSVDEDRLYQLVRQAGPIVDRTFEIEFLDSGVHAYAFTFG
jgi:cytochrome c biogenesis protein CcdA/thiol-disulfide isomerase/thioredoxin